MPLARKRRLPHRRGRDTLELTMFENLTDKLQRAFKSLRGQGTLTEENIA